ncbi:MAG TPA: hypothetical protein VFA32_07030 [Dehalococcoidia bacterium]|nr:hypothetical protein [Dehalococcoidia bacterium]
MNVNKVTATVKYTQDTGKGVWKSLELGCEASINEREDWQTAQATLYGQLAQQFKALWSQNGVVPHVHAPEGHRIDVQPSQHESGGAPPHGEPAATQPATSPVSQAKPQAAAPTREHWCEEHQTEFKKRTGEYGEFFSHSIKGTKPLQWCNESKK